MSRLRSKRGILSIVGAVAVLATVVFVGAALAPSPDRETPEQATQAPQAKPEQPLVEQAQQALASGDTTKAAALAQQALQTNPNDAAAQEIARQAASQQAKASVSGDSGSPGTQPAAPEASDDAFTKKLNDFSALLPTTFAEYELGSEVPSKTEAQVSGSAKSTSPAAVIIWTVHERADSKDAQRFISRTSKELYARDAASSKIDGATAYFGTDGSRYSTIAYARGRYVFEVLVSANGVPPKANKSLAENAAKAFKDQP